MTLHHQVSIKFKEDIASLLGYYNFLKLLTVSEDVAYAALQLINILIESEKFS
jgi:hypothetical protein